MSSTNRGAVRQPDDYYSTPAWCTRAIVPHLNSPSSVLDPCAGAGAILDVVRDWAGPEPELIAYDINERVAEIQTASIKAHTDSLVQYSAWHQVDLIITNPPYSLALPFVKRACDYLSQWGKGQAAFLLRLAFLESKERNTFLRNRMPDDVYVLPKRPSFINGKTDSCAYAWFVWGAEAHSEAARLHVLGV